MSADPNSPTYPWTAMTSRPARAGAAAAVLLASLAAVPTEALAQQWLFTPVVEIGIEHVDNPRLDEGDVETDNLTGGVLDVAAEMRRNTQISSVLFRPSAAIWRYADATDEDSESFFLDFEADRQGQRSEWHFDADASLQDVYRGEVTSADFDEPGVDDAVTGTGRTRERRERTQFRVNPGFSFDFTERTEFRADLGYINTRYDNDEVGEAVDYQNLQAGIGLFRALTEDSRLGVGVYAATYDPGQSDRDSESRGARVRYEKDISNISSFHVELGAQESDIPSPVTPGTDVTENSFIWNLGYRRQLQVTTWLFELGQNVTPSGSGSLVERDQYRISMRRQLRPRWWLQLAAVAQNVNALDQEPGTISTIDRDYAQGRAELGWEMSRTWTVEARYTFTHQDFADTPGDAQEHEARLSLVYRPPIPGQQ